MSVMPGPWSMATTETPWRSPFWTRLRMISPRLAYIRMLRAISEVAPAITVWSPLETPASAARSRPRCRAVTTSTSAAIGISSSSATVEASGSAVDSDLGLDVEERQAFFKVEGGRHPLERQPELHHREGDLGLDPHDHRPRTAQPCHMRDVAQGADGERIHDVERRDVDDDAARPKPPHTLDQRLAQLRQIGIGERRLDRRDQVVTLLQNGNFHAPSVDGVGCRLTPSDSTLPGARPCTPATAPPPRYPPGDRPPSPSRSSRHRSSRASGRFRARGPLR